MFKSLDLSLIVEFILMFYRDKPIDWLLDHILWVKVCNPEKDAVSGAEKVWGRWSSTAMALPTPAHLSVRSGLQEALTVARCPRLPSQKHCDRQKANLRIRFKPSLFQHVGTHSSLAGKIQKLKVGRLLLPAGPGRDERGRPGADLL